MVKFRHRHIVFACASILALVGGSSAYANNKNAYVSSGFVDSKGNALYVEGGLTPDLHRLAPTVSSGANTAASPAVVSPQISSNVQQSSTVGPNLISNFSLEASSSNGLPAGWLKGGYGTNTRVLTYPASPAEDGSRAAKVSISSYTSGDAKWYFNYVPVAAGNTYQFSDWSLSNIGSIIDVQFKMSDGTFRYLDIANPGPSSAYQNTTAQFTVPAGVVSLTIFHLINKVGSLTVDNYSLNQITTSSAAPNLVSNGDFETTASNGLPANWNKGGWGTNTRTFVYPVSGVNGSKAVQVSISSYTSGDAKWYFTPIALTNGVYTYSDSYQSNVPSVLEIQYHNADDSYTYQDLLFDPPARSFTQQTLGFVVPRGVQDVTIFRLISQVGTLTIDNVSVQASTNTGGVFQNGAVTLTFDNGWLSQYQNAIPKMNQYGFKGTFYIITHELSDYGYSHFVSKAQIQNMYAGGQEIGSHTQTHPFLTQLSYTQQQQEIQGSRQDLVALNVGPINSFAYPYGDYDATTTQIVKDAGYTNARSTITGYTTPYSDHYQLPRFVVLNSTTPAQIEQWIDEAVADKAWLIIEFHQVDTSGDTYSITPANFNPVIDYLAQKGVSVVTMDQGVQNLAQ